MIRVSVLACLFASLLGKAALATPIPFQVTTPGATTFTAPVDGIYEITAIGAVGGSAFGGFAGGLPALAILS
jgi:hypothetical protein